MILGLVVEETVVGGVAVVVGGALVEVHVMHFTIVQFSVQRAKKLHPS